MFSEASDLHVTPEVTKRNGVLPKCRQAQFSPASLELSMKSKWIKRLNVPGCGESFQCTHPPTSFCSFSSPKTKVNKTSSPFYRWSIDALMWGMATRGKHVGNVPCCSAPVLIAVTRGIRPHKKLLKASDCGFLNMIMRLMWWQFFCHKLEEISSGRCKQAAPYLTQNIQPQAVAFTSSSCWNEVFHT